MSAPHAAILGGTRLCWSFEVERERVQARVEFFTKRVVNQALTRDAGEPFESAADTHRQLVVRFAAGARACMARMLRAIDPSTQSERGANARVSSVSMRSARERCVLSSVNSLSA